MRWAVNARNKVEKQGDLATLSQIKIELVASYAGHPSTTWAPESVFASLGDIRRSIPPALLDDHVAKHGVLCVQRRWWTRNCRITRSSTPSPMSTASWRR